MTHPIATRAILARGLAAFIIVSAIDGARSSARAWDLELTAAIAQVHLGTATERQLALVRRNNDVVNAMAASGRLNDRMYQSVQADFARFNAEVAAQAAKANKLELVTQKSSKTQFSPGTDSDFITSSPTGKMTPSQIEGSIRTYNANMNERLGTQGVDYAKRLNTDFMANPKQMSAEEFAKVAKLNNDAYKRQGAATLEEKLRTPGSKPTADELIDYQKDMRDLIGKKRGQIQELQTKVRDAVKADPTGMRPDTRDLMAELKLRQQQQAKYIDRYTQTTRLTAEQYNVDPPRAGSDLAKTAADRSVAEGRPDAGRSTAGGTPEAVKAQQNKVAATVSSGLDQHQTIRATGDSVRVNAEAARNIEHQGSRLPEREKLLNAAAEQLAELPPAQRGEVIEDIKRRLGEQHAAELAERTRKFDAEARWQRNLGAAKESLKATGEKAMQVVAIAAAANDIRAWIHGETSNTEAVETVVDQASQGLYSAAKNLAGWKQTYDLNGSAFVNETQARIYRIAKDLHDKGVPLDEVKRLVADMENGSEASVDRTIRDLGAKGIAYTKPQPVQRTSFSDRSWTDYLKTQAGVGADVVKGMVIAPVKLAVDTGKDIGELIVITSDILVANAQVTDAELAILDQQNAVTRRKLVQQLVALGADPAEAAAAVAAWSEGRAEGVERLHRLRDRLKGVAQPVAAQPEPSPEARAARRAHILDRLAKLNHTKLQAAFKAMGVAPPTDFMNCLCKSAGYGAMGTAQYYHPETIGQFNPTYACSQPGDPCIVSGYGCTRHPLPSDGKVWQACIAQARLNPTQDADGRPVPGSGTPLDAAIEEALRRRNARAP